MQTSAFLSLHVYYDDNRPLNSVKVPVSVKTNGLGPKQYVDGFVYYIIVAKSNDYADYMGAPTQSWPVMSRERYDCLPVVDGMENLRDYDGGKTVHYCKTTIYVGEERSNKAVFCRAIGRAPNVT